MDAWELWQKMARESEKAARLAELGGCLRSSASRYYYTAYQAVTALLLYRRLMPPINCEARSHDTTPLLIKEQLGPLIQSRTQRNNLASRFGELYKLRVAADYVGQDRISADKLNRARKDANYLFKIADEILPER